MKNTGPEAAIKELSTTGKTMSLRNNCRDLVGIYHKKRQAICSEIFLLHLVANIIFEKHFNVTMGATLTA